MIRNFRAIDEITIRLGRYASLIGPNNSCKSTILRAVELFLTQKTPDKSDLRFTAPGSPIQIEMTFHDLKPWERDAPGVSSLVHGNQICLRMQAQLDGEKMTVDYEALVPNETIDGWSDKWTDLHQEIKTLAQTVDIDGKAFKSNANKERVRQLVREQQPQRVQLGDLAWTSEGISIKQALQQALPQAQLIPAVRDAHDDCKPGASTSFGLILKKIILPALTASPQYQALLQAVGQIDSLLRNDGETQLPQIKALSDEISTRLSDLITARVELSMETPDAEKFLGGSTTIHLDDGARTPIGLQGHGLQRALLFALLEILALRQAQIPAPTEEAGRARTTVLLFEEPELFIHPHLMRRLKQILKTISDRTDWQVIVTTHSPFLIDVATDPRSLVIHSRPNPAQPPVVKQLDTDPFAAGGVGLEEERTALRALLDFHPTVCEAFFARRVVLVEGDSEIAILVNQPRLYELAGLNLEHVRDVSVVSCAGKWTIPPIARLLKAFGVPTRVIHDRDRKGKTDEELAVIPAIHPFKANARIASVLEETELFVVDDTLEDILWEGATDARPAGSSDKPFRAWRRLAELVDGQGDLNHSPRLRELARFAFDLGV